MNRNQRAGDAGALVNGIIDLADVAGELALQSLHASGGSSGNDDFEVGQARFQRANELGADVDFADADGVQPEGVAIGEGLLELAVIDSEALIEAAPPIAAPPHPHEVIRRGPDKTQRKENV